MGSETLLNKVAQEHVFWFADGTSANSVKQLAERLKQADEKIFQHHVNETKNDFYVWVRDVFKHDALAADLLACEEKQKVIECLEQWVVVAEQEKREKYKKQFQQAQQVVHEPRLKIQKNPNHQQGPSSESGIAPTFQGLLGFDMKCITRFDLPSEAESTAQARTKPMVSTMFKYQQPVGEKIAEKVDAQTLSSIMKQLKEVYK